MIRKLILALITAAFGFECLAQTPVSAGVAVNPTTRRLMGESTNFFEANRDLVNAVRNTPAWCNVLDFGAARDGVTDDSVPLQLAIETAESVGGSVYIPSGSYVVRGDLQIIDSVSVFGDHQDGTRLIYYGTNYCLTVGTGSSTPIRNVLLRDLFFIGWADPPYDGSYAPSNAAGLIKIHGASRGKIENVRTSNARSGNGILFKDRAWIWDVRNYVCFDLKYGIKMECAAGSGDLVSAININGGEISGCDWGIMVGKHDSTLGSAERGMGSMFIGGMCAIEGNREGGIWLNQAENINVETYWEGNPQTHIRLGNQFDTNSWSVAGVRILGNRFATSTNALEVYSAQNVLFDVNDVQDLKGPGIGVVFKTTNHTSVVIGPNNRARQSSDTDYNVPVTWLDGHGSSIQQLTEDPVGNALFKDSANAMFGDDPKSWVSTDRLQNFGRFVGVNSTNGPVGLIAAMLGTAPGTQTRAFVGTDNTNIVIGGRRDSWGLMPVRIESNGSGLMILDGAQTANPNRLVVGGTNGTDRLTVHGSAVLGDPTNNVNLSYWDKHLSIAGYTNSDSIGLSFVSYDQGNNRMLRIGIDPAVPEAVFQTTYSSGGQIPIVFRDAFGTDIMSLTRSNVVVSGSIAWNGVWKNGWSEINETVQSSTGVFSNLLTTLGPLRIGTNNTAAAWSSGPVLAAITNAGALKLCVIWPNGTTNVLATMTP